MQEKQQKQQILFKNTFNTTLKEKIPRHSRDLGRDFAIMGAIPWSRFRRIRYNDRGRCGKRGRKRVKRWCNRGEAWELTWAEKKLRNAEHLNISDIRKNQDLWYLYAYCWNILTVQ